MMQSLQWRQDSCSQWWTDLGGICTTSTSLEDELILCKDAEWKYATEQTIIIGK